MNDISRLWLIISKLLPKKGWFENDFYILDTRRIYIHTLYLSPTIYIDIIIIRLFLFRTTQTGSRSSYTWRVFLIVAHSYPCMCMCARGELPSPLEHLCRRVYDDVNFPVFVQNRTLFGSDSSQLGGDVKCCRPDKLLEGVRRCRSCSNPAYYLDGACIMRRSRPKCHRKPKRKCKLTVSKALSVLLSNNW